jgi:hypothetical protein
MRASSFEAFGFSHEKPGKRERYITQDASKLTLSFGAVLTLRVDACRHASGVFGRTSSKQSAIFELGVSSASLERSSFPYRYASSDASFHRL